MILGDGNRTSRLATIHAPMGPHSPNIGARVSVIDRALDHRGMQPGLVRP
ncbi:hypothetical protein FEAC_04360 [Ferrimicrobium acidiphilum DSM 19497]|uniref:Uncharacterized protein n=1 Tax=Ferrimicrobium acidiphilum DSM 19497 TaxID=1121877 RepID=A0A0D8FX00_9ACTN|nr:hypothetical protein FEAC_04360 [Ferrimicrobium acidiphilum DSM 19497]